MSRHRLPLFLLAALLSWAPAADAETAADCPRLADDAARLACFDAAAAGGDLALLTRLLGDPVAIGKDYLYLGNSAALRALLPGRWLMLGWDLAAELLAEARLAKACERGGLDIAPSARDSYALTATATGREGERLETFELLWTGGSSFAQVRNLDRTLAHLGLDPARQGYGPAFSLLRSAAVSLTLLPLSDDVLLAIAAERGHNLVLLRCPGS